MRPHTSTQDISMETHYLEIEQGGYKMIDMMLEINAYKVKK